MQHHKTVCSMTRFAWHEMLAVADSFNSLYNTSSSDLKRKLLIQLWGLPFLMRRLVTLRRASRGERWKNLGDRFGGSVNGFLESLDSQGLGVLCPGLWPGARRSRCSMEAGRCCRCRGYQPRPGPPASRRSSAPARAWLNPPDPSATPVQCTCSGPVPTRL